MRDPAPLDFERCGCYFCDNELLDFGGVVDGGGSQ